MKYDPLLPFLVVAFSGGRSSAFMTYKLIQEHSDWFNVIVVFANTGKEREETLKFVHECDMYFGFKKVWIEALTDKRHGYGVKAKIVNYYTASRKGEPFRESIAKHGISNKNAPMCTRELKTRAIDSYLRSLKLGTKEIYRAIGIRVDEFDRIAKDREKKKVPLPYGILVPYHKRGNIIFLVFANFRPRAGRAPGKL